MKNYKYFLIALFIFFAENLAAQSTKIICKESSIPSGWVVTREELWATGCKGGALRIERPGDKKIICKEYPYPSNYVITADNYPEIGCGQGTFWIEKPDLSITICKGYSIPSDYVITYEGFPGGGCKYGTYRIEIHPDSYDADGDGFKGILDCDDNNSSVYVGAEEVPNNDIDEDCDGDIWIIDKDKDGVNSDDDFDDNNPYMGIKLSYEIAGNRKDDNCNGLVDEVNQDKDRFWVYYHCTMPGNTCPKQDCDDTNPYAGIQRAQEISGNRLDDDCDGLVDEADEDGDGFLVYWKCLRNNCPAKKDCNDNDDLVYPGARERANNGIDDDCDGLLDEKDEDDDGFLTYKSCNWDQEDCPEFDCDDTNDAIYPGAKDIVNNTIDEDCNGSDNIVIWQMAAGGTDGWKKLNRRSPLSRNIAHLLVGDFDGDEVSDILRANGNNWILFSGGKEELKVLEPDAQLVAKNMRVGDFNGDGIDDLLNATGRVWRYAAGGKKPWIILKESTVRLDQIHIGDFDGDSIDDIAVISSQKVKYASGGTGAFQFANGKTFHTFGFLIGDFNGDGQDDIFNGNGEEWRILYSAAGTWKTLRAHPKTTEGLAIGYFNPADEAGNPDLIADIFMATGEEWRAWYGGKGGRRILKTISEINMLFGDFDGDGITDVFRIRTLGH